MRVTFVYLDVPLVGLEPDVAIHSIADLPLGLGSVRAYAQQDPEIAGRVEMVNRIFPAAVPEQRVTADILETSPDLVAFTCFVWNMVRVHRVCEQIKSRKPETRIVVGGHQVPAERAPLMSFLSRWPAIDVAVWGEGERTFAEVLKAYLHAQDMQGIAGAAFRRSAKVVVGPAQAADLDLETVPSPYLSGAIRVATGGRGLLVVETSRGCPFACAYCDYGRGAARFFPLERLREEVRLLRGRNTTGELGFADPTLNLRKDRFLRILEIVREWGQGIYLNLRPDLLDEEQIEALSGLRSAKLSFGIQSTNPKAMEAIDRPMDLVRASRNIRAVLRHPHLQVYLEIILGLPGDDYNSFKGTLDWVLSFGPQVELMPFDLLLLPNTPLLRMRRRFGIEADAVGRALRCRSFSHQDLAKSSWLLEAYRRLGGLGGDNGWRPSEALERTAGMLVRSGILPANRVFIPSPLSAESDTAKKGGA